MGRYSSSALSAMDWTAEPQKQVTREAAAAARWVASARGTAAVGFRGLPRVEVRAQPEVKAGIFTYRVITAKGRTPETSELCSASRELRNYFPIQVVRTDVFIK
jgi:hypothetical protein